MNELVAVGPGPAEQTTMELRALPASENPVCVYLARLGEGSRRTMRQALKRCAGIMSRGTLPAELFPWERVRYQHVAGLRERLREEELAPATVNKDAARNLPVRCSSMGSFSGALHTEQRLSRGVLLRPLSVRPAAAAHRAPIDLDLDFEAQLMGRTQPGNDTVARCAPQPGLGSLLKARLVIVVGLPRALRPQQSRTQVTLHEEPARPDAPVQVDRRKHRLEHVRGK